MKKPILYPAVILFFCLHSCKKSNSGNSEPPVYYLSSVVAVSASQRIVDSFYYDSLHRIDTFSQSIYDTISGGNVLFNNWSIQFLYDGNKAAPSWYNFYDISLGGLGDYHLLSYDAQGRITRDTSLSGSGFVSFFSYPTNTIVNAVFPEGNPQNNTIDTLYMTSGNISRQVLYSSVIPGQPDVLEGKTDFTDAPTANPAYHAAISGSIGPLLFAYTLSRNSAFVDFISKNTWQGVNGANNTSPFGIPVVTYNLTTDGKGRLLKMATGSGANQTASVVFSYY